LQTKHQYFWGPGLFVLIGKNEQPKGGDVLRLGIKGRYGLCVRGR